MSQMIILGVEVATNQGLVLVLAHNDRYGWARLTPRKAREMAAVLNAAADEADQQAAPLRSPR